MPSSICVLGICPGTRNIALAVVKNGELRDQRIKSFHGRWSENKLQTITSKVCAYALSHKVTHAYIKEVKDTGRNKAIEELIRALTVENSSLKILVTTYSLEQLKLELLLPKNCKVCHDHILMRYPNVKHELNAFCPQGKVKDKSIHAVLLALIGDETALRAKRRRKSIKQYYQ